MNCICMDIRLLVASSWMFRPLDGGCLGNHTFGDFVTEFAILSNVMIVTLRTVHTRYLICLRLPCHNRCQDRGQSRSFTRSSCSLQLFMTFSEAKICGKENHIFWGKLQMVKQNFSCCTKYTVFLSINETKKYLVQWLLFYE